MGILGFRKGEALEPGDRPARRPAYLQPGSPGDRRLLLEDLFREFAPRVLDYARNRGASLAEAEDVVSEVFIVLTRRLGDAPPDREEILPWLLGVARKVLSNHLRGTRRRQALAERSAEIMQTAEQSEDDPLFAAAQTVLVRQGLARLRDKEREALLLVTWDGFKYEEAALILGCSPGALAQRVLRGRKQLLEEIGDIRTYRSLEARNSRNAEPREE